MAIDALSAHAAIYRKRYRLPLGRVLKGAGIAAAAYLPWRAMSGCTFSTNTGGPWLTRRWGPEPI
jgi:hypothetical protein